MHSIEIWTVRKICIKEAEVFGDPRNMMLVENGEDKMVRESNR